MTRTEDRLMKYGWLSPLFNYCRFEKISIGQGSLSDYKRIAERRDMNFAVWFQAGREYFLKSIGKPACLWKKRVEEMEYNIRGSWIIIPSQSLLIRCSQSGEGNFGAQKANWKNEIKKRLKSPLNSLGKILSLRWRFCNDFKTIAHVIWTGGWFRQWSGK